MLSSQGWAHKMQVHQMTNLDHHLFEITTRIWFENSVEASEKSPLAHPISFAALSAPVDSVVSANAQAFGAASNVFL
jgi:hypothetical protein